eukprot:238841-Hanusia_phi.AAC.1
MIQVVLPYSAAKLGDSIRPLSSDQCPGPADSDLLVPLYRARSLPRLRLESPGARTVLPVNRSGELRRNGSKRRHSAAGPGPRPRRGGHWRSGPLARKTSRKKNLRPRAVPGQTRRWEARNSGSLDRSDSHRSHAVRYGQGRYPVRAQDRHSGRNLASLELSPGRANISRPPAALADRGTGGREFSSPARAEPQAQSELGKEPPGVVRTMMTHRIGSLASGPPATGTGRPYGNR